MGKGLLNIDVGGMFSGVTGIISELVEDKDARNKITLEVAKLQGNLQTAIVQQVTVPWVDALVKLMYAFGDTFKGFIRPFGAIALTYFAADMRVKGTPLPPFIEEMMFSSGLLWGASRYAEKKNGKN